MALLQPIRGRGMLGPVRPAHPVRSPFAAASRSSTAGSTQGRRVHLRTLRAVSGASVAETAVSLQTLKQELQAAIQQENYKEAARLRDEITQTELADPELQKAKRRAELEIQLKAVVAAENFEEAAKIRDELKELAPKRHPTHSRAVTAGVRVEVQSFYMRRQSSPEFHHYVFAYRICITNEGDRVVQLQSREWVITNGKGQVEVVRGPGVVGKTPVLKRGEHFEYSSYCQLSTPAGCMEGFYEMAELGPGGEVAARFNALIARFGLDMQDEASHR